MSAPVPSNPALKISLFGPMETYVEGHPVGRPRSRKASWALALLALRHGRPVERQWLAGTLWPDASQSQAFSNLRPVLSELRRSLESQGYRLQSEGRHTVAINLEDAEVDVVEFDRAIASGKPEMMAKAVSLYQGGLLEGCAEEWVFQERDLREQQCLAALQSLADAALASGDNVAAIGYCRRAIGIDPLWEAGRRGLMEALDRSGDRNAAMQVFRDYSNLLRSEWNTAPDERTTALYTRLRTELRQRDRAPVTADAPAIDPVVTGFLPHPVTPLIGRDDECDDVSVQLRRSRLVTLTGAGGIGKTRLAVEIAAKVVSEYPDGVWLISLEALSESDSVSQQTASVLGVKEEPGRELVQSLVSHLLRKRLLLVFDNCEHVLRDTAHTVGQLLAQCVGIKGLATSREALGIPGENVWPVPSLAAPNPAHLPPGITTLKRVVVGYEAVQLFVERASSVQKSFLLTGGNALAVARICFHLEGIPLAIELAAARVKTMTIDEIEGRLNDYLLLLTSGSRIALTRQQTLRATLDWSHALLSEPEQVLLRRLSVFLGGWRLDAAEEVCSDASQSRVPGIQEIAIADLLGGLVDKSMVVFQGADHGGRYRFLEMVRQYADEKLGNCDEDTAIRQKHRHWCIKLVNAAEPELRGPEQERWFDTLALEGGNIRSAIMASAQEPGSGLLLAGPLWRYWYRRGLYAEGREMLAEALRVEVNGMRTERAKALYGAGCLAHAQSDYANAIRFTQASADIRSETGDRLGLADSLNVLGNISAVQSHNREAREYYEASLAIWREAGNKLDIALGLYNLGTLLNSLGDLNPALSNFEEGVRLYREAGDSGGIGWCLTGIGSINECRGEYAAAEACLEEAYRLFKAIGNPRGMGWSLQFRGTLHLEQGFFESAEALAEASLSNFREIGYQSGITAALVLLGSSLGDSGDLNRATALLADAFEQSQQQEIQYGMAQSLDALGMTAYKRSKFAIAQDYWEKALRMRVSIGDKRRIVQTICDLALTSLEAEEFEQAAHLWGAAEAFRESLGTPLSPRRSPMHESGVANLKLVLGEDRLRRLWNEGRSMSMVNAVDAALAGSMAAERFLS